MKNRQITIGAILSYGAIAFNIISGLVYTPWMIHTIGDDQYALYALAISVINFFLMDFGIGSAVTRFLSNYYAEKRYEDANRFMGIVYKVFFCISCAIAVCLIVFYFLINKVYLNLTQTELQIFKRLFVIVATYSVFSFPFTTFNGVLMANERFIAVKACNFGQKALSVVLIVAVLLMGGSVYSLVIVHALSNVVFILLKYLCIRCNMLLNVDFTHWDKEIAVELFGFSAWVTIMSLAQRCIFNIMPSIIAAIYGSVEVALFSVAATLEGYVYSFADAINGMFFPKISRILVGECSETRLASLMGSVGRFHVATIGLLFIGFLAIGSDFVVLWMGDNYEAIYICAVLMIFPSLIDVPQQVAKTALLAKNVVREQAMIYLVMAILNLAISFALVPSLGAIGAAISIFAAYLFRTVAFNVLYKKCLAISLISFFKNAYGRWVPIGVITLGFGMWLDRGTNILDTWSGLVLKIILILIIYAMLYVCIGLKKEERHALTKWLHGGRD